jgi:hypothetical protein
MTNCGIIKIHDGTAGLPLFVVTTEVSCGTAYSSISDMFRDPPTLVDLTHLPNPLEIVESESNSQDVVLCLLAVDVYSSDREDFSNWMIKHNYPPKLLSHIGDIYVVVDMKRWAQN